MIKIDQYAVFGNPIAHSLSPQIHTAFAAQTQQNLQYTTQLVAVDGFEKALIDFQQAGGCGLNVTVPFKEDAFRCCRHLSKRAQLAGAVNTISFSDDGLSQGDNTDGVGLVKDISHNHAVKLARKRVLILGAGGAVRGVLAPLLEADVIRLHIANRTVSKAEKLCALYKATKDADKVTASSYGDLVGQKFDIIINGTSAGLQGSMPELPDNILSAEAFAYDMVYGQAADGFLTWAKAQGAAKAVDGLGMLVEQAAAAFNVWRGIKPETQTIITQFRNGKTQ
jgi:shikimate dehydrogenase